MAVAILAFGLLGIAALQATALRNSQSSYERSQAVSLTYSILDRMRANARGDRPDAGGLQHRQDLRRSIQRRRQAANDLRDWMNGHPQIQVDEKSCGTIVCNQPGTTFQCTITRNGTIPRHAGRYPRRR